MPALARWTLRHKRLVVGFWLAVTIAAFAAIGPAGKSLSQQFGVPGREGFEANQQIAAIYGSGGDVAPLVPVVQLPKGTTVDSRGVRAEKAEHLASGDTEGDIVDRNPLPEPLRQMLDDQRRLVR